VDHSASWPQISPVLGANTWTAPLDALLGRYEIRIQYFSIEVGEMWEAEGAVTFYVCQATGGLHFTKYHDLNANGIKDAGEPGIPLWKVSFTDPFGSTYNRLTDANGEVVENSVPIGDYSVWETLKPGWINATPLGASAHVGTDETEEFVFGNYMTGSIGDYVFYDDDQDGFFDNEELGIGGVALDLYLDEDEDGIYETYVDSTVTNQGGWYLFDELPAGLYVVELNDHTLPQEQYVLTTPPEPREVNLAPEEEHLDADFGYYYCKPEECNGVDDDCDGQVDEDFPLGDACDGDDSDLCTNGTFTCTDDGSGVECVNESEENITELCNLLDDDCDGEIDEDYTVGDPCD